MAYSALTSKIPPEMYYAKWKERCNCSSVANWSLATHKHSRYRTKKTVVHWLLQRFFFFFNLLCYVLHLSLCFLSLFFSQFFFLICRCYFSCSKTQNFTICVCTESLMSFLLLLVVPITRCFVWAIFPVKTSFHIHIVDGLELYWTLLRNNFRRNENEKLLMSRTVSKSRSLSFSIRFLSLAICLLLSITLHLN